MPETRSRYHHGDLRSALIESGLELARSGGADALRLREVTRHVGVSPNAAYRHFANHHALLSAVAAEIQDRMAEHMRARMTHAEPTDPGARAVTRLRGVGLGYVDFAIDEPGWFQLAFFAPTPIDRPDGLVPPPLTLLLDALDALVDAGSIAPTQREGAEWTCWSAVHGFAELATRGPLRDHSRETLRAYAARVVDDVIAGLI